MEQIKNSKGEILAQPYLDLARMRREKKYDQNCIETGFFNWGESKEGHDWWFKVIIIGKTPEIHAASLAELEEWRKSKGIAELQHPEPDWKAMYESEKEKAEYYEHLYHQVDTINREAALLEIGSEIATHDRNWVAECAMVAMQGLLSRADIADHTEEQIAAYSFFYAEAWVAEGVKRGHLPNNQK